MRELDGARLVLVLGAGGVGKTTLAAALAADAAARGRRALVLTVDPARRLASALGVALGDVESDVPVAGRGELAAAMLESGASFDALLARIVADEGARAAILASATYQAFSRTLARSHAYAAIERIHAAVLGDGARRHDLVVVDTPPGGAALELLDAPTALARFAGDRIAVALSGGGASALLLGARALFGALAGAAVARELADFLAAFLPARAGFEARARAVERLFRDDARRILCVAPDETHLAEAEALAAALAARGLSPHGVVANRALTRRSPPWTLGELGAELSPDEARLVRRAHELGERERAADRERSARLDAFAGRLGVPTLTRLPRAVEEPTTVAALIDLIRAGTSW